MGTIRTFDISQVRTAKHVNTFIETGTLHGDGVQYAIDAGFQHIISIEIMPDIANAARERFKNNRNVTILTGNSTEIIKDLLPTINNSILFWLDAHFPGADVGIIPYDNEQNYDTRVPLEKELELILEHSKQYKDIIICDDLWVYEDNQYGAGSFNTHMRNHGFNVTKEQICGNNLDRIYDLYRETHVIQKNLEHQGYLILKHNEL